MAATARRLVCALAALILLTSSLMAAYAQSYEASFFKNGKVYQKPSTKSASMKVPAGMEVTITAMNGDWAQLERNGLVAYCPVGNLILSERLHWYVKTETKLYKSKSGSSAYCTLGVGTDVYVVGRDGNYYMAENKEGTIGGYIPVKCVTHKKPEAPKQEEPKKEEQKDFRSEVVLLNWFDGGNEVLKKGQYGYIYDVDTGIVVRVKRMGGSNHADMEPATAEDTEKLLKIAGGEFSWKSKAVILISGDTYAAAAINTLPHGDQTILDNNYDGQFCLHMVGSKTHGSDSVNEVHQEAIIKAYRWAQS